MVMSSYCNHKHHVTMVKDFMISKWRQILPFKIKKIHVSCLTLFFIFYDTILLDWKKNMQYQKKEIKFGSLAADWLVVAVVLLAIRGSNSARSLLRDTDELPHLVLSRRQGRSLVMYSKMNRYPPNTFF